MTGSELHLHLAGRRWSSITEDELVGPFSVEDGMLNWGWGPLLCSKHTLGQRVYTFEASCSTLSATFPTDNRISVLCCRASVIRKDVTSLEPENNTIKGLELLQVSAFKSKAKVFQLNLY